MTYPVSPRASTTLGPLEGQSLIFYRNPKPPPTADRSIVHTPPCPEISLAESGFLPTQGFPVQD